jgi:multiple sugar transport system substrate-binding protein
MGAAGPDARNALHQFQYAYDTYRRGCAPPDAVDWVAGLENNEAFVAQRVVLTSNTTLTVANALKSSQPDDYFRNTASIEWPNDDAYGQPLVIEGGMVRAAVFKNERSVAVAKDFVRFLIADGWLAHYLDFSLEAYLPPMKKLLDQPFWLDPRDPHRMIAAIQALTRLPGYKFDYAVTANWRLRRIDDPDSVWQKAIHRVAADGISPEQAVDEAIARIKEILSE